MILVGSDDGVYHISDVEMSTGGKATKTLDSERVMRLRQFEGVDGVFAATNTGLYRSLDGKQWTEIDTPHETVYAVAAVGDQLYIGTRPAHIYVTATASISPLASERVEWRELDGFQELPSRDEWRLPRHDSLAHVRDLCVDPAKSDRLIAGVEVGGVHISDDGGETWTERSGGVDDDIHELHVVGPGKYIAATGHGLYHTNDAGQTWTQLDHAGAQSYFRCAFSIDGVHYASGALSNSSTWDDDGANPALFAWSSDDSLDQIEIPRENETVTGMTNIGDDLIVATHRGNLFVRTATGWREGGTFPVLGPLTGRYTPVTSSVE
ncbi:WD40/YVTN/BNR-like repeat-containing protein [Halocatena marina]|nr:WD40 repeat domain-containing protein [Halocatena marina]